VMNTIWGSD